MGRSFTLIQLRYFHAVAAASSMTAAAATLNVTQSALSTSIAQLEQSLGVQLFIRRRTRTLTLTPAGRHFAIEAAALLERADALEESAKGMAGAVEGALTVGVFGPLAPFQLPRILRAVEAKYPGLQVSFLEADLATLHAALFAGECEIALMYDLGLPEGLDAEAIDSIPPHVLVAADHPAARTPEQAVSLRDFADEPMIQLDLPHSREYYVHLFQVLGIEPRVRHAFAGYETVRSFVANGHGYTVLNQRLHDLSYSGGRVVALTIAETLPPIEVMLVRPRGSVLTRRALAFEEVCRQSYWQSASGAAPPTEPALKFIDGIHEPDEEHRTELAEPIPPETAT